MYQTWALAAPLGLSRTGGALQVGARGVNPTVCGFCVGGTSVYRATKS